MSTPVKLFAAAGVIVICALGAAELIQRTRPEPKGTPAASRSSRAEPVDSADEAPVRLVSDYSAIAQRNLFRPLVSVPKTGEGAGGGGVEGGGPGASGPRAAPPSTRGSGPGSGPPQPPDPLADLALTGVVEVGGQLRILIEKVSARTGQWVALNAEYDGFRVVLIGESSAVLERGGKQYTLRMGGRELPAAPSVAAATSATAGPGGPSASSSAPSAGPSFGGGQGGMMGGFSGDMLSWAEGQSLPDLERMYGQYGQYLSSEDRARAEAYLESRRARGR